MEGKDADTTMANHMCTDRTSCTPLQGVQTQALTITSFKLTSGETEEIEKLREICDHYMVQKVANHASNSSTILIGLQSYFILSQNLKAPECSNVLYYKVLDQRCDSKETLLNIIHDLYTEFVVTKLKKHILLEGDQATYERLQSIKREYGNDLAWMIPFPGDWHLLKNYQEVLLKIYFDAGLSELAKASGYLPTSINANFKRTHHFLLEVWESMYRHHLSNFFSTCGPPDFLEYASHWIHLFPPSGEQACTIRNLKAMINDFTEKHDYR